MALHHPNAPETEALLEQLLQVNQQLLSFEAPDMDGITQAIERRGQLVSRVGHLLRDAEEPTTLPAYRAALDEALEAGERAIQRLLTLRQTIRSKYVRLKRIQPGTPASDSFLSCDM